jgi:hypothetical protein
VSSPVLLSIALSLLVLFYRRTRDSIAIDLCSPERSVLQYNLRMVI